MKHSARYESDTTIVLAKPVGRHAKDARPKPPPRHALGRPASPPRVRPERIGAADAQPRPAAAQPEHATVRFRLPSLAGHQVRPRHLLIGAALLAAGLAGVAGAGVAAHRVDAATPPRLAAPSALALPAPVRLALSATMLPSTGIHSTRPVTTGTPVRRDDPAIANSRAHRVHPPAGPQPAWNPSPTLGPDERRPNGTVPHAGPTGNPPVDPTPPPTTPSSPPSSPPSDPTTPPSDPTTPPSDPTTPPTDPTTPPSTTPTPPSTTPTPPSDSPTDSGTGGATDTGSSSGGDAGSGDSSVSTAR